MNVQEVTPLTERRKGTQRSATQAASTDERLLVAEAKSGCSNAFGELYERHRLRICRTAFRILRNQEDAEDAAQRAFQSAFVNLARFREDSTFSTWVTRIATNEALLLLRQRRPNTPPLEGNSDGDDVHSVFDLTDKGPTPEEILAEKELCTAVIQAISHLREKLRTVVHLRELQELTSTETARRLDLTVSAVKARVFHARRHLRRHLEPKYKTACTVF
jgi:RNA polymerase sigma-70 factor, ECF subfamily